MNSIITQSQVIPVQGINTTMLNDFINYIDASPRTVIAYKNAIRQLLLYFSENAITTPDREDIIHFREKLKQNHKVTTVQNYMVAIRLFFKWTATRGLYPNIAENLKGAKVGKEHKKDYLTSHQVKQVLDTIDTETVQGLRDYAIVSLMVTAGLRDTEVVHANIEDIHILGDCTVLYVLGKGRQEKAEYVKIVPTVEKAIRTYLKARNNPAATAIFISHSNHSSGQRLTTRSVSRIVKKAFQAAGYESPRLTAHSLRHTAVTLSLLGGQSLQEVQQFARHSNIATTQIYAHNLDRLSNQCENIIANTIFGA